MSMKNSYFEMPSPLALLQRWLNPETHSIRLTLRNNPLTVSWTRRADRQLQSLNRPLLAEMQLYFTCVVKKRVLFHQQPPADELEVVEVNEQLQIAFRPVEANSCDPQEFAANFPVKQEFETMGAVKMHPSQLRIDYKGGNWVGEFNV